MIVREGTKLKTKDGIFVIVWTVDADYRVLRTDDWLLARRNEESPEACYEYLKSIYKEDMEIIND